MKTTHRFTGRFSNEHLGFKNNELVAIAVDRYINSFDPITYNQDIVFVAYKQTKTKEKLQLKMENVEENRDVTVKPRQVKFFKNQNYEVTGEGSGLLRAFHKLSQQTSIKLNVAIHALTLTLFFPNTHQTQLNIHAHLPYL